MCVRGRWGAGYVARVSRDARSFVGNGESTAWRRDCEGVRRKCVLVCVVCLVFLLFCSVLARVVFCLCHRVRRWYARTKWVGARVVSCAIVSCNAASAPRGVAALRVFVVKCDRLCVAGLMYLFRVAYAWTRDRV